MDTEMLPIDDAAKLLEVSPSDIQHLMDAGALEGHRDTATGALAFSRNALLAYQKDRDDRQRRGLENMAEASAEMGMYDVGILQAEVSEEKRHGLADPHAKKDS